MRIGHYKIGMGTGLLGVLQALSGPVLSTLVLIVTTHLLPGVEYTDAYTALALIAGLLYYSFLSPQMTRDWGATFVSGWTLASRAIFAWAAVIAVLLLVGYAAKVSAVYSRRALFIWALLTPALVAGTLIVLRQWFRRALIMSGQARTTVIAGVNEVSRRLAETITARPELGLKLLGFFDDRSTERLGIINGGRVLGNLDKVSEFVKQRQVDTIFITIPINSVDRTRQLLSSLQDTTASIYFVPDIFVFDLIQARSDDLNGIPVVAICETPFHGWQVILKRFSDIVLASIMLLVALPAMGLIALAIKATSPGRMIFTQRRYGLNGEEILIYKFRTMTVCQDGDHIPQATRNDSRITPLGHFLRRYSLDELPQLINVLQGRMSVVGPRPHAVAHNEQYRKLIGGYMVRHKVTPGITGLAQVNGCRGETENVAAMERRVQYDLEYLRHWSLLLDMKILVMTLATLFRDPKAY